MHQTVRMQWAEWIATNTVTLNRPADKRACAGGCPVCMRDVSSAEAQQRCYVVAVRRCRHVFHQPCLMRAQNTDDAGCPACAMSVSRAARRRRRRQRCDVKRGAG